MFKVGYVLQFKVKQKGGSFTLEANLPVLVMTPSLDILSNEKPKRKIHPGWDPYLYGHKELYMTLEDDLRNPYAKYRKWLIQREKDYVEGL